MRGRASALPPGKRSPRPAGHIVFLFTSPRVPPGLLTARAWDVVRAHPVLAAADSPQSRALRAAGVDVALAQATATVLCAAASGGRSVVWLADPDTPALVRDTMLVLAGDPGLAGIELLHGSWDVPGARLLDVVAVMDRLVSPGGDPWKREQTHQSLAHYLLEEAYEAYDAMVGDDAPALREELGDVLLQVVLHARMAQEATPAWSVDDVAGDLVDKLIRRNPHVFSDVSVTDLDEIVRNWERIKREEKPRGSILDGVAASQPALALAGKILSRVRRAGATAGPAHPGSTVAATVHDEADLGRQLFALVAAAHDAGLDAEGVLRHAALCYADEVRAAERATGESAAPERAAPESVASEGATG